jgi:dTDP-glucose pyrophosphorylase
MIQVLLLFSGPSTAFQQASQPFPKNLAEVRGQPLVQFVLDQLSPLRQGGARFICTVRQDENRRYHTASVIRLVDPEARVVELAGETAGAACSALLAIDHLSREDPLLVINGDQLLHADLSAIVASFQARGLAAATVVFEAVHPRWSFVRCDASGHVVEAAEKRPISRLATAGIYYFARGATFLEAGMRMILKDAHRDGLFYVCPMLNEVILSGGKVGVHQVPRSSYQSLATPEDIARFNRTEPEASA